MTLIVLSPLFLTFNTITLFVLFKTRQKICQHKHTTDSVMYRFMNFFYVMFQ